VNSISCTLTGLLIWAVNIYSILLLVYAVLSWVPDLRGPWSNYIAALIEPVLIPIRRIVPPLGGLDMAFLVLLLGIQFLIIPLLRHLQFSICYGTY